MEHIGDILKRQTQTDTSIKNTEILSNAEESPVAEVCPFCQGAGYVHPLTASGKPDYSRVVPCRCTLKERDKEQKSLLQRYSGLEAKTLQKMTFDNFDKRKSNLTEKEHDSLKSAFNEALDFAKSPEKWLVLQGVNGCGKTHLAAAIANYRLKEDKPVKFVVVPDLLDHLRSSFSPESPVSYDRLFEEVRNAPLLILDDLGKQSTTPWAQEKLYQIINHRYNYQLPTVITTNCKTDELDPPISSRLVDFQISNFFTIMAPHFRTDVPLSPQKAVRPRKQPS